MDNSAIGKWIKREGERDLTQPEDGPEWHKVETIVNDRIVTRCGRSMADETLAGKGLEMSDTEPLTRMIGQPQLCKICSR